MTVPLMARRRCLRRMLLGFGALVLATGQGEAWAQTLVPPPPPLAYPVWQRLQSDPAAMAAWQKRVTAPVPVAPPAPQPPGSPWTPLTNQPPFNAGAMLLLTDGTVIVSDQGSQQTGASGWWRLTPDITGSYANGTWSQIASLPSGYMPEDFASAVLPDGRVIIEGGEYNGSTTTVWTNQGAIYDPVANNWTAVQPPNGGTGVWSRIGDAPSAVLADGTFFLGPSGFSGTKAAALLNESGLTWTTTGAGKFAGNGEQGWTLLSNGDVLTVDTLYPNSGCGTNSEIYSPSSGTWSSAGSTIVQLADCLGSNPSFEIGPQVLRPDGTVVVFGATTSGGPANTAIYDSNAGTWSAGPNIPVVGSQNYTLADAPAALLPSGNILFAASPPPAYSTPTHFFLFAPGNTITQVTDPRNAANLASDFVYMLVLPTGQILFNSRLGDVEVYTDTDPPDAAWAPVIQSVPTALAAGQSYQVSGQQLNGLSQGAAYGDDYQSATSYPLVRIVNQASGHAFYARSFGFTSMSVAPGVVSTANFTVPNNIESGGALLYVIGDGVASTPVAVTVTGGVAASPLVAAVLPESRSVTVGRAATAFATMINGGSTGLTGCGIAPPSGLPLNFEYQTTNPATNAVTGSPNTPVTLGAGNSQSFVVALTPTATLAPTNVDFSFACSGAAPAPVVTGLDTLLFSGSTSPVPDIVALAATASNDGTLHIPGSSGANAFAVATVNLGAAATITATANTGTTQLPLALTLCQTNPGTGQCLSAPAASATATIGTNATPTFGIFGQAAGQITFAPAIDRIFVDFTDSSGAIRGATSVAVATQ